MPLGTAIFLFAVGAILRYAVTASVSGVSIHTIGLILMIVMMFVICGGMLVGAAINWSRRAKRRRAHRCQSFTGSIHIHSTWIRSGMTGK